MKLSVLFILRNFINLNQGASTAGTGALKGYAIVPESAFDSDVYMLARLDLMI